MAQRRFRILGLPLLWAVLLGIVVFILWKPIVTLFKGLVQKFKQPASQTATEEKPVDQAASET
jgi:hypothetical protein